jgi:uncharacterized protein
MAGRRLLPPPTGAEAKPVDVGNGRLVASVGAASAELISLLAYHPQHGVVELSAMPPFDDRERGDRAAVRRYRALMADGSPACIGLETTDGQRPLVTGLDLSDPRRPTWQQTLAGVDVEVSVAADSDAVTITWRIGPGWPQTAGLRVRLNGRLDRPALAEVTDTDPPPPTGASTALRADGRRLDLIAAALPAAMTFEAEGGAWWVEGSSAVLSPASPAGGLARTVRVRCTVDQRPPIEARPADGAVHLDAGLTDLPIARIVSRALAYVRGCTALRTAADEVAILTDHRILPLSWTRDAYYQAQLLLASGLQSDGELVADHLRWLWRRCERPGGRWLRSHHADGRAKDRAFQADQQLYPLLELADYWREKKALPTGVEWSSAVRDAWAAALAEVDGASGLMASAENAADDPAPAPFLSGAQVLLWYTAERLAELAAGGALDLDSGQLRRTGQAVRIAFDRHFADGRRWAYATDGHAARIHYHDANDLPLALAPLWGFCTAEDPRWQATMAFGSSAANPGFFGGPRGGLGSVHTPMPWTLGDVQAWIRGRAVGDQRLMAAALERLSEVAFVDGMLPEAYSAEPVPDVRIRHWFAWPAAAIGALLLLDGRGELEARLGAAQD